MKSFHASCLLVLSATALLLGGCASPAQSGAMVPTSLGPVSKHTQSISLNVTGGSPTSAAGASQISNEDYTTALTQAIEQSGLFAKVIPPGQAGDYHLEISIVRLQQPMMGFSMTATIETNWTLTRISDHSVVWQKAITTSHTTKTSEALAGVKRLRLATEGSARDNIQDAIQQMSALNLQ